MLVAAVPMTVPATPKNEQSTAAEIAARQLAATCANDRLSRSGASGSANEFPRSVMAAMQTWEIASDDMTAAHVMTVKGGILWALSG